jgi:hypothetical protein
VIEKVFRAGWGVFAGFCLLNECLCGHNLSLFCLSARSTNFFAKSFYRKDGSPKKQTEQTNASDYYYITSPLWQQSVSQATRINYIHPLGLSEVSLGKFFGFL